MIGTQAYIQHVPICSWSVFSVSAQGFCHKTVTVSQLSLASNLSAFHAAGPLIYYSYFPDGFMAATKSIFYGHNLARQEKCA